MTRRGERDFAATICSWEWWASQEELGAGEGGECLCWLAEGESAGICWWGTDIILLNKCPSRHKSISRSELQAMGSCVEITNECNGNYLHHIYHDENCCLYMEAKSSRIEGVAVSGKSISLTFLQVPAGSLPRTTDVILRHDIVESARAGDKVVFTGNVIVVPDVGAISTPGERVEASMSKGLPSLLQSKLFHSH